MPSEVSTIDHILVSSCPYTLVLYHTHASTALSSSIEAASYDHSYVKHCNPPNFESDHWSVDLRFHHQLSHLTCCRPVVAVFNVQQLAALRSANVTLLA